MTETDNRLIHAYVTDGGCWHEWKPSDPVDDFYNIDYDSMNPDYSSRAHFPDLTAKLFGDERMWEAFVEWSIDEYWGEEPSCGYIPWLFSDYDRFVTLFARFLRLPETVREFGWYWCPDKDFNPDGMCVTDINLDCPIEGGCNYTGQVPTAWAKLVEEGK
jgi:hypothetical protein